MKVKQVFVNWVLDDEELLEPYEWGEEDDLEVLDEVSMYHVDSQTMYDLYYCQLVLEEPRNLKMGIFSDGKHSIVVEFDIEHRLKYRSLLQLDYRESLHYVIEQLEETKLLYHVIGYGDVKEFGLTRLEREKKQYIYEELSDMYYHDAKHLLALADEYFMIEVDDTREIYHHILDKLDKGYSSLHESLYQQFVKER